MNACLRALMSLYVLVIMGMFPAPAMAGRDVMLGVFSLEPLITVSPDGVHKGPVMEFLEYVAAREDWTVSYIECDLSQCLSLLEAGKLDLMGGVVKTAGRMGRFDFAQETFFMDWAQIYARKDKGIHSVLELNDKAVAMLAGTSLRASFDNLMRDNMIKVHPVMMGSYDEAFHALEDGRVDFLLVNRMTGQRFGHHFDVQRTPLIFGNTDIRYAAPKGKGGDLLEALDRYLKEAKASGVSTYSKSIERMVHYSGLDFRTPAWVGWAALSGSLMMLAFVVVNIALRREVGSQTRALQQEVKEKQEAERLLLESREYFRTLVEHTDAIYWEVDAQSGRMNYVSPQAERILGYHPQQWRGLEFLSGIAHSEDREQVAECLLRSENFTETDRVFSYRARAHDGRIVWLQTIVKSIMGPDGRGKLMGTMFDITGQMMAVEKLESSLREKDVLLREVHHRVKNNMTIITALCNLQANAISDPEAIHSLKENQTRIRAMALVHEQLYQSGNLMDIPVDEYITSLAGSLLLTFGAPRQDIIDYDIDKVNLNIDTLIPCGLIINELLTNSVKYAFDDFNKARIRISFKLRPEGLYELTVGDNGRGLSGDFDINSTNTLGFRLVRTLADQLSARLTFSFGDGTVVRLIFGKTVGNSNEVYEKAPQREQ